MCLREQIANDVFDVYVVFMLGQPLLRQHKTVGGVVQPYYIELWLVSVSFGYLLADKGGFYALAE